jgi:ribosomal protein L37AE/L43A
MHGADSRSLRKHYSELDLQHTFSCGGCHGEQITSIKVRLALYRPCRADSQSFAGGAFYVTTDHGKVVIHRQDGETHGIAVCASGVGTWRPCGSDELIDSLLACIRISRG